MPELRSWGGGLGDSGNARKKTFFFVDPFPQGDSKDNLNRKDIKGPHLNLLEGRHKVARGALCHVDVAGEQGVGEAREQPADEVLVHVGWQPVRLE